MRSDDDARHAARSVARTLVRGRARPQAVAMSSTTAAELGIELRHLRYFLAVAEHRHFTRAAERLHMAQPPLSAQIRRLERRVGTTLFERKPGQVTLTPAGEALVQDARAALAAVEHGVAAVRAAAAGRRGRVRVALGDAVAVEPVLDAVKRLALEAPDLRVQLSRSPDPLAEVGEGTADVAVLHGPVRPAGLTSVGLASEPRVALVPAGDQLARLTAIALAELPRDRLIEVGHTLEGAASPLENALAEVAAGRAVAIVPAGAARRSAEISLLPLTGALPAIRVAVHRPDDAASVRFAAVLATTPRSQDAARIAEAG
jgi:DNA-binding transcriptional LysR family regulator